MRLEFAEDLRPLARAVPENPRHRQLRVVVDDAPRHATEVAERGGVPVAERLRRLGRKRLHKPVVAVREIDDQGVRLAFDASDHDQRFAEVGLGVAWRMGQRHEHLLPAQPLRAHGGFHDRVAAREPVLRASALAAARGRVPLLLRPGLILAEDLINDPREGVQLRTPDRLRPAIPGRPAGAQHLAHRLAGQPEAARRRALAQSLHRHAAPHRRIEFHSIHPSCVPQHTLGMLGGPRERSGFPPPSGRVTPPLCGLVLLRRSQPFEIEEMELRIAKAIEHRRLKHEIDYLRHTQPDIYDFDRIVGASGALQRVLNVVKKVAQSNTTVLIRGETGTGKELIAGAIHHNSARASRNFVRVNCAALQENLLESELFGHEKGAFTGADRQRVGRFEQADGGSLFLDEVGDMSPNTQAKILRVLQEHEFERLGGTRTLRCDVRIVAATNRNLAEMVAVGEFREDLYYRLNVVSIDMPPLRERKEDIPELAQFFTRRFGGELNK